MAAQLCSYCNSINLDDPATWSSLGKRSRLEESHHQCPFCYLVWHCSNFEVYDDSSHVGITWTSDGFVPGKVKERKLIDFGDPLIVPIKQSSSTVTSPKGVGRQIGNKVTATTLKGWLDLCDSSDDPTRHSDCTAKNVWDHGDAASSKDGLKDLWLVDVNNNSIHRIRSTDSNRQTYKYAVLSYVIGDDKLIPKYTVTDLDDFETGGLENENLPKTHRDAMRVTRMVGLRYLWVDALCLPNNQLNDSASNKKYDEGIANFDRIYEGAELTIIAADGDDADGGISAIHQDRTSSDKIWQYWRHIPGNNKWGLIRGVYDRLKEHKYVTRGWTYQEIALSHRCLIFVDGLAFFRCRARLYSEDTFWDDHDDWSPSPGIMTYPYEIEFLPRHISDPWLNYAQTLQVYRTRDYRWEQTIDAYRGILNRISHALDDSRSHLVGLPKGMFDMALLWYHRPDINLEKTPRRIAGWPSWSWVGWWQSVVSTFTPFGDVSDRRHWVDHHAGIIDFWYTHSDGTDLRQVDNGTPPSDIIPTPEFAPGSSGRFLQFQTWITMNANVQFGKKGIGRIFSPSGMLAGMVYADDLSDYAPQGNVLVALSKAPHGDPNFDYGLYFPDEQGYVQDGDEDHSLLTGPPISAKNHSIQWVLLTGPDGRMMSDGRAYQHRRGLGFIHTDKVGLFDWGPGKSWVALV